MATYSVGATILSCCVTSLNHVECVTLENQVVVIDVLSNEVVRTISWGEKMKVVYGNVNTRVQRLMKGEKASNSGVVLNARVYANSNCYWGNRWYIVGFDRVYVVSEVSPENRFNHFAEVTPGRNPHE